MLKRFNARHGITVGLNAIDFIDETGQILSGTRISFLSNPSITTDQPLFNANQTWNNAATPFTGFRINVTDTASNASSKLMDLQVGGVSKLSADKAGNVVIAGDLTVQGATVTMNTATIDVEDTNITLGKVTTPTDVTANGGGITLLGATNKTLVWGSTESAWNSSENVNLVTGKTYKINNVSILSATDLAPSVVASSLTSVGTLTTGTWNASVIAGQYGGTGVANTGKSITLGGNLTTSGAFDTTLTVTAATNVTLPTTGTLVGSADTGTVTNTMLAGSIANAKLANSTISGVALGGTLGTLTLDVFGTGLSGSATYDGSGATTFTVTSNATNLNTASAIVARDASGNFSAGSITAALLGNASTATKLETPRMINGVAFDGTADITAPGGATGGGQDAVFMLCDTHITADYTIPAGTNAGTFGPVIIDAGVSITVPAGSRWTIV